MYMIHAFEFKCPTFVDFGVQFLSVNPIRFEAFAWFGMHGFEAYSCIILSWLVVLFLTK